MREKIENMTSLKQIKATLKLYKPLFNVLLDCYFLMPVKCPQN